MFSLSKSGQRFLSKKLSNRKAGAHTTNRDGRFDIYKFAGKWKNSEKILLSNSTRVLCLESSKSSIGQNKTTTTM